MKKMTVLVKQVLMSTLTAGMFAMSFTACSDNDELLPESNVADNSKETAAKIGNSVQPIGLIYNDFITPNDVQIMNADTTQIAISKALADKKGITSFLGRPMGIKQSLEEIPYLRRAIKEELVGDRYILTVVPAGVAEVLAGQQVELNTGIYINPDAAKTRGGEGNKYVDDQNRIHPVAVRILSMPGEEGQMTRSGGAAISNTLTAEQILNGEEFYFPRTRGTLDDIKNFFIRFIASGGHATADAKKRLVNMNGTLTPKKVSIKVGPEDKDTLTIDSRIPYNVTLDYTLKFDTQVSVKSFWDDPAAYAMVAFNPFGIFTVDTKSFETRLDGSVKLSPEVAIGIGAKAEIPKEQQNYKIASLGNYLFDFQVGPVPIPVVLQPALYLHVDASIEGRIYTGIKYEYESEFFTELTYHKGKGWGCDADYKTKKDDLSLIPPRGTIKGKAGVGVMLGCDVMVASVAGPSFSVGPMVTAGLDVKLAPWDETPFTFDANVKMGIHGRAGAKLKLWTLEIADWQTDVVFGPEKTLWECHLDNNDIGDVTGYSKLIDMVKQLKEEAEAEAAAQKARKAEMEAALQAAKEAAEKRIAKEAAEKKAAEEALLKAASEKNWNAFVAQMKNDSEVQDLLKQFKPRDFSQVGFNPNPVNTPEQLFNYALNKTFSRYDYITTDIFSEMKSNVIYIIKSEIAK